MNLSARDLRAVLALAQEGNFTRAARRVHLSQPAFSGLIQAVEEGLGARLFDRTTRHVSLTPEGALLVPAAQRLLGDLEGMVDDFRAHAQARTGSVGIAALPSLAAAWLPDVLAEFHASHPGVALSLVDTLADECRALLRARQVDFAIATAGAHGTDFDVELLCKDQFHLVCPADHPLATQRSISLADLASYPFVHLSRNSSVRQHLEAAFHPVQMRSVVEVGHLATVTGLVSAGLGISVVPALTLFHFRQPQLAVRPLHVPGLTRELVVLTRHGESLSAAAQAFRTLMLHRKPRPGVLARELRRKKAA